MADLRLALAVLLPLEQGLSLKQTADNIGRSVSVTCSMRTRFGRVIEDLQAVSQHKQQLRNRAHADLMIEAQMLDEVLANAATGGVVIIARLKPAIEAKNKAAFPAAVFAGTQSTGAHLVRATREEVSQHRF